MFPDRIIENARKFPRELSTAFNILTTRDTLLTMGGMGAWMAVGFATEVLYSQGLGFLPSHRSVTLIETLIPAVPIYRGVFGNAKEYLSRSEIFRLRRPSKESHEGAKMVTAGFSLHSAGEFTQILAGLIGGSEFGLLSSGDDFGKFLFDPHNLPYWALNIPGFFLMGKAVLSPYLVVIKDVKELAQKTRSLTKPDLDNLKNS